MSQRKHGDIVISIRGERSRPQRLQVTWTTKADQRSAVKASVAAWAKNVWKRQRVQVDVTTLDTEAGGKILINGETEPVARFTMQGRHEPTYEPEQELLEMDAA